MASGAVPFEGFRVGDRYRTLGRTVSEYEILSFVTLTGFTEPLFMDLEYIRQESVFKTRVAPSVLTFAIAEGLVLQTGILHGTGLAVLPSHSPRAAGPQPRDALGCVIGYDVRAVAPVLAGDTIRVEVEVVDKRETKKPDRGVVSFPSIALASRGGAPVPRRARLRRHRIMNQRDETVMEAAVTRMIKWAAA